MLVGPSRRGCDARLTYLHGPNYYLVNFVQQQRHGCQRPVNRTIRESVCSTSHNIIKRHTVQYFETTFALSRLTSKIPSWAKRHNSDNLPEQESAPVSSWLSNYAIRKNTTRSLQAIHLALCVSCRRRRTTTSNADHHDPIVDACFGRPAKCRIWDRTIGGDFPPCVVPPAPSNGCGVVVVVGRGGRTLCRRPAPVLLDGTGSAAALGKI